MGYDMYIVGDIPGVKEKVQAARDAFHAAVEKRDALPDEYQGGLTPEQFMAELGKGVSATVLLESTPANQHPEYTAAQAEVDRTYEAMLAADVTYFRLNIHGMGAVAKVMWELGALRTNYPPDASEWPSLGPWMAEGQDEPVDMDAWYNEWRSAPQYRSDGYREPPAEAVAAFQQHEKALAAKLAWVPEPEFEGDHRIPAHKFGDNSGWHVTPAECTYAAKELTEALEGDAVRARVALATAGWGGDPNRMDAGLKTLRHWAAFLERAAQHGGFKVH